MVYKPLYKDIDKRLLLQEPRLNRFYTESFNLLFFVKKKN